MELTRIFQRLLLIVVLLGLTTFWLADDNLGMLLVVGSLAFAAWYFAEGGRCVPQWVLIPAAMLAVMLLMAELFFTRGQIVRPMVLFIMGIQLLLLAGRKSYRQYAEVIGLSLAITVAAVALGNAPIHSAILLVQLALAVLAMLLLQLKRDGEQVQAMREQIAGSDVQLPPLPMVHSANHHWHFRGMAACLGVSAAMIASMVVSFLPRGDRVESHFLQGHARQRIDFRPEINLGNTAAEASVSSEVVLTMKISVGDRPLGSENVGWLLRGAVLDRYDRLSQSWKRSDELPISEDRLSLGQEHQMVDLRSDVPVLNAEITLLGKTGNAIFTLHPLVSIDSGGEVIRFHRGDQHTYRTGGSRGRGPLTYSFSTAMQPVDHPVLSQDLFTRTMRAPYARTWGPQVTQIRELTNTVLAAQDLARDPEVLDHPDDYRIALAIMEFLRTEYSYVATPPSMIGRRRDPTSEFLLGHRTGHCELFASAMAAMTRSIGMRTRVITGYRVSEFNTVGSYYVARRENAHAWCEVYIAGMGWVTMDPSPPEELDRQNLADDGWITWFRQMFEHIAFAGGITAIFKPMFAWFGRQLDGWTFTPPTLGLFILLLVCLAIAVASLVNIILVRRRRLKSLQLTGLPGKQRRALTRELGFYLLMLDLLERQGLYRPAWQCPFSFALELADRNPQRFSPVVALTEVFYEVRFGRRTLDQQRRSRIRDLLHELERALAQKVT